MPARVKCPNCGASVRVDERRLRVQCEECDTKFYPDDEEQADSDDRPRSTGVRRRSRRDDDDDDDDDDDSGGQI